MGKAVAANVAPLKLKVLDGAAEAEFTLSIAGEAPAGFADKLTALNTAHGTAIRDRDTANTALTASKADTDKFRSLAVNALIDGGKISAAEKEALLKLDASAFETEVKKIKDKGTALNREGLNLRPTATGIDLSSAHGRTIAFNAKLDEYHAAGRPRAAKASARIDDALAAMRIDPTGAPILQAMDSAK